VSVGEDAGRLPDKIGKYRVVERIGRGGMGMIFKAHDPILQRPVALKVISPEVEVTDELRARFFREAQACAKLNHPNIVTVYDMGEDDGRLFIVMELLEGDELRSLIKASTLSLEDKVHVMLQVCHGLHYAHLNGVVHRDMKPGNIFRLRNGQAKVLDFGIAHIATTEAGLTRTGLIMGTLRYISPEQVRGRFDHRSDMFSLGSVFYELLTSQPPFRGEDPMQLLEQLRSEDPLPPTDVDPTIPPELTVIVQRAMRKDPDERFHDLEEMRSELELVHGTLIEKRQRVGARVRHQRDRIIQLRAALADRVGAPADEEPIPVVTERSGLATVQAAERELARLIQELQTRISKADALAPAMQRANQLLSAAQFEDAAEQFETILTDLPEHRLAREGLARARAEAEAVRQRELAIDILDKARAALDDRRYALCLEMLKPARSFRLPTEATDAITALREAAEAGLAEEQTLRIARQKADNARVRAAQARAEAQAEEAAHHASDVWSNAETTVAAAEVHLRREVYAEAAQAFDRATAIYRRALDAARQSQIEERRIAERARDVARQGLNQARAIETALYARGLWDAAEARFAEAETIFAQKPSAPAAVAFTEASALYRRAEDVARETRERERRRAEAARERAAEGRRSGTTVDAEHRALAVWQDAVKKSNEGEAAFLRHQYAKAVEAFEAALAHYHQAQAEVRELTRRQREETRKKQQDMAERRRSAVGVEAASHAATFWIEAEASAATGDQALAREAWEDAGRAFDEAATLYQRAEQHSREALQARAAAETAMDAAGLARRTAAEAEAATYAPDALKEAESAEARAIAAFSRQTFTAARPLFDDASRLYGLAARAAGIAAAVEARELKSLVDEPIRASAELGDATTVLIRPTELIEQPTSPDHENAAPRSVADAPEEILGGSGRLRARVAVAFRAGSWRLRIGAAFVLTVGGLALVAVTQLPRQLSDPQGKFTTPLDPSPVPEDQSQKTTPAPPEGPRAPEPPRPTPAPRTEPDLRVLRNTAEEARRTTLTARQAAEANGAPKLAASLWTQAETTQRRADEAFKERDFDKSRLLFGEAHKTYQEAQRVAGTEQERLTRHRADADRARGEMMETRHNAEQANAQRFLIFASALSKENDGQTAFDRAQYEFAAKRFREAQSEYQNALQQVTQAVTQARTRAEQVRSQMIAARSAAVSAGADSYASNSLGTADAKEREAQAAFDKPDYEVAASLFLSAQSLYESSGKEAAPRRQVALQQTEQAREKMSTARDEAVRVEADRFAKNLFDAAEAKQADAVGLFRRQKFTPAANAFQEAAGRYEEAAGQARTVRDAKARADRERTHMAAEKRAVTSLGRATEAYRTAMADEAQAVSLYEQFAYKEAADKFKTAAESFERARRRSPGSQY